MILDFNGYMINEASLKKLKRQVHGTLNMSARKRMRKELRDNIITFKFRKRNGELRTAHGTLHPDYLPPLKGGSPRPEHQMVYYDLDKNSWRSFRSYSFIKILNIKPVEGSATKPVTKPHPKPVPKPTTKSEDDEEVKKTSIHKEDEEKMKEKEEKVKEKEVKKKIHEIDDEIEDDDDHNSVIDDKETPEEKELVDKEKEDDKKENEDK